MFLNASTWTSHKWKKSPLPRWQSCIRAALGKPSTQHIVWTLTDSFQGTHMHQPYGNRYPMGGRKIMFPWKPNWDFYSLIYCSNYIETSNIQSLNIQVTLAMKRIVIRDNVLVYIHLPNHALKQFGQQWQLILLTIVLFCLNIWPSFQISRCY